MAALTVTPESVLIDKSIAEMAFEQRKLILVAFAKKLF
jgi:hypothetical protein